MSVKKETVSSGKFLGKQPKKWDPLRIGAQYTVVLNAAGKVMSKKLVVFEYSNIRSC